MNYKRESTVDNTINHLEDLKNTISKIDQEDVPRNSNGRVVLSKSVEPRISRPSDIIEAKRNLEIG